MKKKDYKFLEEKLSELVDHNIISSEQCANAKDYFSNLKSEKKSLVTIFLSLGILLIALSVITLFAINWDTLSKSIKVIISFVPLVITSVMLYISMSTDDKKMKLYTSIIAPIAILATNSLISQVFHIQTEIYELILISTIMFLPIAFILRNYISIIVYGLGTIIYAFTAMDSAISDSLVILNTTIIAIPTVIYNIINYRNDKDDRKNLVMWVVNVCLVSLLLIKVEIVKPDSLIIYPFMIYLLTKFLFKKDNFVTKIISVCFILFLIISCTSTIFLSFVDDVELSFDTILLLVISGILFYLLKSYETPKDCLIGIFVLFLQFSGLDEELLIIIVNLMVGIYGIYNIVLGNKNNSNRNIKQGVALILLLILFRFISSDLSFAQKSVIFLLTGLGFMGGANYLNKKGGQKDE